MKEENSVEDEKNWHKNFSKIL